MVAAAKLPNLQSGLIVVTCGSRDQQGCGNGGVATVAESLGKSSRLALLLGAAVV